MPPEPVVLVTGATGFVGRHLLELLAHQPWSVRCLVRRRGALDGISGVDVCPGDLGANSGLEEAVAGVDIVFHLAGITKACRPEEYYRGNVDGTRHLVEALERTNPRARLVHVSSLAAVGPSPGDGSPLPADVPAAPLTHYGRSKLKGEEIVRRSGIAPRTVILRPPAVYGPRDTDVFEVLRAASRGLLVRIGREEQYFSLSYVKDLAAAVIAAGTAPGAAGRTYFVASQDRVSWTEFATMAALHMGKGLRIISVPPGLAWAAGCMSEVRSRISGKPNIVSREKVREARRRYWLCDGAAARRDLMLEPATPLDRGLAETLAWYREAGWLRF